MDFLSNPKGAGNASFDPFLDAWMFGNGADGDVTVNGAVTLTRDMYFNNLTVAAGAAINPASWRIFVKGTLDLTAAPTGSIFNNAGNAANATNATGGTPGALLISRSMVTSVTPGAGAAGGTGVGTVAAAVAAPVSPLVSPGAAGGAGGTSGVNAGGASRAGNTAAVEPIGRLSPDLMRGQSTGTTFQIIGQSQAAPGGSSGGGDGTGSGGGGGGGASGGGGIGIFARTINRGPATAAGAIQSKGGIGGNGASGTGGTNRGGGGGGGGGAGGLILVIYRFLIGAPASGCFDVTGGAGGAGANGVGTGVGGDAGGGGPSGLVIFGSVADGTVTASLSKPPVPGGAHSGATGGAATPATTTQVSL